MIRYLMLKTHVSGHVRRLASGRTVAVVPYDDRRRTAADATGTGDLFEPASDAAFWMPVNPEKPKIDTLKFYDADGLRIEGTQDARKEADQFARIVADVPGDGFSMFVVDKTDQNPLADLVPSAWEHHYMLEQKEATSCDLKEVGLTRGSDSIHITLLTPKAAGKTFPEALYVDLVEMGGKKEGESPGKHVLRNMVGVALERGCQTVDLFADLRVGGYAWARFGFAPLGAKDSQSVARSLRSTLKMIDPLGAGALKKTEAAIRRLEEGCGTAIWDIADLRDGERNLGKELLLDAYWDGRLDLRDPKAMARLKAYVAP